MFYNLYLFNIKVVNKEINNVHQEEFAFEQVLEIFIQREK